MWTVATYLPTTLFSLKPAVATSSGGKTLLCPTPFAIKMALLDAALRIHRDGIAESQWAIIRDAQIRLKLPEQIAVVNTFTKIVRPKKHGPSDDSGTGLLTPLGSTIAYREYVSFGRPLALALQTAQGEPLPEELTALFQHITYFGKRGGFMQLLELPATKSDELVNVDHGWIDLTTDQQRFAFGGTLQMLDDCGAKLTFDQVNIYSGKRMALGKDRVLRHIVLPYEMIRSSRSFTLYRFIT
jgi:hypothetical protein